ncbi:HEPN domain-containing protein [Lutispora thermophila]|uniref:Uncharacterized protein n=1 Tax=Lutispora thermophila DSM 19022 TaxID=1122184 RepID=A0A1M6BBQ1_9FIRM|nr:HEPN domain-containing protein [Lutispora thermophila]SHI46170.1 hypothetical protein SAMN02745176_00379 [Lutispora thermophila DSM 19022]
MKEKFAFIAFSESSSKINEEIYLSDELKIYPRMPFNIDDYWEKWLGAIKISAIKNSNLVIYSSKITDNPDIIDQGHEYVKRRVLEFYYSLALYGVPRYSEANMIIGSINEESVSIRGFSYLDYFHFVYNGNPKIINKMDIFEIYKIYKVLSQIYSESNIKQDKYFRIRYGLNAYFKAIKEKENYYRISQLVRAIEALIKPRIGKTKKDFAHRCKTFVIPNPDSEAILQEIYELRNKVEHIHPLTEVFPTMSRDVASEIIDSHVRKLEEIARNIYIKLFLNPDLLDRFLNNNSIDKFWSLSDQERDKLWGSKLDIKTIK